MELCLDLPPTFTLGLRETMQFNLVFRNLLHRVENRRIRRCLLMLMLQLGGHWQRGSASLGIESKPRLQHIWDNIMIFIATTSCGATNNRMMKLPLSSRRPLLPRLEMLHGRFSTCRVFCVFPQQTLRAEFGPIFVKM